MQISFKLIYLENMLKKISFTFKKVCLVSFFIFLTTYSYFCLKYKNTTNVLKKQSNVPFIFVGGSYRSGTTLMRVMLDSHPQIRCGQETRILPRFLDFIERQLYIDLPKFEHAGISRETINEASSEFISRIIFLQGKNSSYICTKDPEDLKHIDYLTELFPKSKFILMIRDARATVHSIIKNELTVARYSKNYTHSFIIWNNLVTKMYVQCIRVGSSHCLPVYYEQLILHPEREMRKILKFLNVHWNESVLSHEKFIGNKILTSEHEISTDQVINPINLQGLNSWVGNVPEDVLNKIDELAPLLRRLGYDTKANPPNYLKFYENKTVSRDKILSIKRSV